MTFTKTNYVTIFARPLPVKPPKRYRSLDSDLGLCIRNANRILVIV